MLGMPTQQTGAVQVRAFHVVFSICKIMGQLGSDRADYGVVLYVFNKRKKSFANLP